MQTLSYLLEGAWQKTIRPVPGSAGRKKPCAVKRCPKPYPLRTPPRHIYRLPHTAPVVGWFIRAGQEPRATIQRQVAEAKVYSYTQNLANENPKETEWQS